MFQTFEGKSFLEWNPGIIHPNFKMGVEHCVPCLVFLFYHWTRWGKFHHVRPHGCERPCTKAIFLPSIFCRSLLCTASPLRRRKHLLDKTWKCSTNLPNSRSHSCASSHVLVFPLNTGSLFLLLKPCHLVTGLFWDTMGSFACLFDIFYYSESTTIRQFWQFLTAAWTLKIINTPLTQQRHGIRTKRPVHGQNPTDKKEWI